MTRGNAQQAVLILLLAARWLLAGMEPGSAPPATGVPALPAGNGHAGDQTGLAGKGGA